MKSTPWRLIIDEKSDGYLNMATDEAIFQLYPQALVPTLRVYGWNKPFVSIGYHQDPAVLNADFVPFVRRITGGSAILHDREITYSITCSTRDLDLQGNIKDSYKQLCQFLKNFYHALGLRALFANEACPDSHMGRYGNYCFSSNEEYDLVIHGKKIGGNAQRRKKALIFQQGSIPQKIDLEMAARVFKGAHDDTHATTLDMLLGRDTEFAGLQTRLSECFLETFRLTCTCAPLSEQEMTLRDSLLQYKYRTQDWNHARKTSEVGSIR